MFDTPQLRQLVHTAQRHPLRTGEFLFYEGEPGERIFLIRRGQLEIVSKKSSLGRIALRSRGEWIGEMALLEAGGLRTASARALEPSFLVSWDRAHFNAFLQQKPQLGLLISRLLSQRLVDLQKMAVQEHGMPRVGHVFGEYLLLELLEKGGMGSVFRVRHLESDQLVALASGLGAEEENNIALPHLLPGLGRFENLTPNRINRSLIDIASNLGFHHGS